MNVLSLTGNLGQDCRVAEVSGTTVCNFSVAMKSGFGDRATTVWIDCALWGKAAEGKLPEYLTKGQNVAVSGELSTSDKEGKTYLKLRCNSVDLVGAKSESAPAPSQPAQRPAPQQQAPAPNGQDDFDSDIPF
jgi:single-strand DNA-binding protein